MTDSPRLTDIMGRNNRIATVHVAFTDIEKYSKRRTVAQIDIVDAFNECLASALKDISQEYIEYTQTNNANFQTDIVKLPTGDGAALVFPFDGLHDVHLYFAKSLLKYVAEHNSKHECNKFTEDGWCNCHPCFHLTIGLAEGKAIIYKDINNSYNFAGSVINMAARVMGKADRGQILFTEDAFKQIVELDGNSQLVDMFERYEASIKHNEKINIYHYVDAECDYINSSPPKELLLNKRSMAAVQKMSDSGFPVMNSEALDNLDRDKMVMIMENLADAMPGVAGALRGENIAKIEK